MKAVLFEADFAPKPNYRMTAREKATRNILIASQAWKDGRISIAELPVPEPKSDELLIKLKACGYCGSDVHLYENTEDGYVRYSGQANSPVVVGHEFSGVVEKVGADVIDFQPGDMVTSEEIQWCGECYACRSGLLNQCRRLEELGFTVNGGMAEYIVVKSKYVWKINALLDYYGDEAKAYEAGAMVEPTGVAYNALFIESGGIRPGADVAVFGTGPIGLAAINLLKAAGAAKIIAFEVNAKRAALAKAMGAEYVYDPLVLEKDGLAPADVMRELTAGVGVNMILEASGVPQYVFPDATRGGAVDHKTVLVGLGSDPVTVNFLDFLLPGASLHGSVGHAGSGIFGSVIRMMAAGRIDVTPAITLRLSIDDAIRGFEALKDRDEAKVMLKM